MDKQGLQQGNLPSNNRQQLSTNVIELTQEEREIAKELTQVNLLITFALTPFQIAQWARCVLELEPKTEPFEVRAVIDMYKRGLYEWDQKEGVQNIFRGLFKHANRGV